MDHVQTEEKIFQQKFNFPELPYSYDALEPYFDKQTMEIHYSKHHRAYYEKFLNAIKGTKAEDISVEEIFNNINEFSTAIRNNGGGYYNHSLFWTILSPAKNSSPTGEFSEVITKSFGSFEKFKEIFNNAATMRFGSGWAWLSVNNNGDLQVSSSPNQDNPLMNDSEYQGTPILNLDVWEHAYYLKYQNRRPDYINAFWNIINWEEVEKRYLRAI